MKRKIVIMLLCGILVMGSVSGCGTSSESAEKTTANTQEERTSQSKGGSEMFESSAATEEELAAIETAAAIVIEPLSLKTDWEEKASITLSSNTVIEGTGAEVKDNVVYISEGGAYELTGTLADGMIYVETDEVVKLILNGVNISNSGGPGIYVYNASSAYIELAQGSENVLTDGAEYTDTFSGGTDDSGSEIGKAALYSKDELIFLGTGSLTVTGNYKHAICSNDTIYLEDGNITLSAVTDGVHANDGICIDGGNIRVLEANDGMESEGAFVINGGTITVASNDDGLTTLGNMEINGGIVTLTSCEEGLEAKNNLVVNDGTIEVTGNDDGINGGSLVEVNGGLIYLDIANGDGLDSNGVMRITGGVVAALGAQGADGGADCDQNTFEITGGTLIATGGTNSSPTEADSTQVSVLLGSSAEGDEIAIKDHSGNVAFAFAVNKQYSNMLLSTPSLKSGQTYTVFTGGTISGTETFNGYYEKASYTGGSESTSFTSDSMVVSAGGTAGGMGKGGRGGMGQKPEGGQMPEGMEPPEDGQMPEGMEPPEDGQMPEGTELPEDTEFPGNSQTDDAGQQTGV